MSTVKINQKKYDVPEMTFKHLPMMEKNGLSLMDMMSGKYVFTTVQTFTCIVVGCDADYADHLLEQHILGGGSVEPIFSAFIKAMNESSFFAKLLETKKAPAETSESN